MLPWGLLCTSREEAGMWQPASAPWVMSCWALAPCGGGTGPWGRGLLLAPNPLSCLVSPPAVLEGHVPSSKLSPKHRPRGGDSPRQEGSASPGITGQLGPPPLCPGGSGADPLSLLDLTNVSNGTTSAQFPVPSSPGGVTFRVPACFLAAVPVPASWPRAPPAPACSGLS